MKYSEIYVDNEVLILDYKKPKWYLPLMVVVGLILLIVMILGTIDIKTWEFIIAAPIVYVVIYIAASQYIKKRKMEINYEENIIKIDNKEYSIGEVEDVVSISYLNRSDICRRDYNAVGLITAKQAFTTYVTHIVFKDKNSIRVYYGFKGTAKKEAERFKRYLRLV